MILANNFFVSKLLVFELALVQKTLRFFLHSGSFKNKNFETQKPLASYQKTILFYTRVEITIFTRCLYVKACKKEV